ncbi:hypothetical protein EON66_00170 [archaeon]|nr:MAG: hypothetical protein EON66_00170 [archaeon]
MRAGEELLASIRAHKIHLDSEDDLTVIAHDRETLLGSMATSHEARVAKIFKKVRVCVVRLSLPTRCPCTAPPHTYNNLFCATAAVQELELKQREEARCNGATEEARKRELLRNRSRVEEIHAWGEDATKRLADMRLDLGSILTERAHSGMSRASGRR